MRDKINSVNYFNNYINKQLNGIELFKSAFDKDGEGRITKEKAAKTILMYYTNLLRSKYSVGSDENELRRIVLEMLPYLEYTEYSNFYVETLWLLSLSYILEIEVSKLEQLKQRVVENKYDDYLISSILNAIFNDVSIRTSFNWPSPYGKLKQVLDAKEEADIRDLEKYLTSYWYQGHSDSAWYESHKSDRLAYAGYWSFETAALVKLFNLDDENLKDMDYYPYDLLHTEEDIV